MRTFCLWLCFFALPAAAEQLTIVHIQDADAVTSEQVKTIYAKASWYFQEIGIGFRVKVLQKDSNCEHFHKTTTRFEELRCLTLQAYQQKIFDPGTRRNKFIYFMTPPFYAETDPEKRNPLIAGIAYALCGVAATGNAEERNGEGLPRLNHSATILAHEIFHLLCASHQSHKANIMHPAANIFTTSYRGKIPVLRITKRQIKRGRTRANS